MRFPLISACLLAALIGACDKKRPPPEPGNGTNKTPAKTSTKKSSPAPKGVPQSLKDKLDREWPEIEANGKAFLAAFDEAKKAQNGGDRAAMQTAIEKARKSWGDAAEQWAEFDNWIADQEDDGKMSEADAERCRRFLGTKERTIKSWQKKAKVLKELSTVR